MRESRFEKQLVEELEELFPGCYILKNDAQLFHGIPDRLILWGPYWAMLEVKASHDSDYRPNQEFHLDALNEMSFAAMICPENKEEVLHQLQRAFST